MSEIRVSPTIVCNINISIPSINVSQTGSFFIFTFLSSPSHCSSYNGCKREPSSEQGSRQTSPFKTDKKDNFYRKHTSLKILISNLSPWIFSISIIFHLHPPHLLPLLASLSATHINKQNQCPDHITCWHCTSKRNRHMDFRVLEQQKENIQPKPSGRPASKLALALREHPPRASIVEKKNEFELILAQHEELDDPLQAYLDYISWTHDTFPQGGNTESGLLALLERCTSCFRDTPYYKNDPRYLKVWLEYSQYSDLPREIFVYLAKKGIGCELALYYEEFAKYLEVKGALSDAMEVYGIGIEREARPLARLQRSLGYFQRRTQNLSLSGASNMRSVLSIKRGGAPHSSSSDNSSSSSKRPKFTVHRDSDPVSIKESVFGQTEKASNKPPMLRLKENVIAARPWAGEVLKQKGPASSLGAKFEVFKDSESAPENSWHVCTATDGSKYTILQQPNKPTENLMVNMNLLYPSHGEQYSPTEVLCQVKNFQRASEMKPVKHKEMSKLKEIDTGNCTMTIPLNVDDSTNHSIRPKSPTLTQFSRMTAKEVLNMFNDASKYQLDEDTTKFEDHTTTNLDGFVTETFHPRHHISHQPSQGSGNHISNQQNERESRTPPTAFGSDKSSPFMDQPW